MVESNNMSKSQTRASTNSKMQILFVISLTVVGVTIVIGFFILLWRVITRIDPSIAAAMITVSGTILAATGTVVAGRVFERKKMIESEQRAKWASIYEGFIHGWLQMMGLDQPKANRKPPSEAKAVKFFADFSAKAMPWASPEVIKQWSRWKSIASNQDGNPPKDQGSSLIFETEHLILAMRRDLGHKDSILDDHQILRMFISDLDSTADEQAT